MKAHAKSIAVAIAAAALFQVASLANAQSSPAPAYLTDSDGRVVRSGAGLCWRTIEWTPELAIEECDPVGRLAAAPAAKPVEEKVPVAAPVKVAPQKISISNEALFGFDSSVLNTKEKAALDDLVDELAGVSYETLYITGHTDRLGSQEYNQKLSERRAQSVKEYLVGKNIPASRINTQGKGMSEPVTRPGDCLGLKSFALIKCLQPDRRIEIKETLNN